MTFGRLIRFLAGALAFGAFGATAQAQDYPVRSIKMVIAFPAGGPTDFVGRLLADSRTEVRGCATAVVWSLCGRRGGRGTLR